MCTRTQDRQGIPARSASQTSLAKVPATCVQDARIGYIQNVLVFETLRIAGSVPPVGRHHTFPTTLHVTQYIQHITVELQWHKQQTDGTKHLPRGVQHQSGGHSGFQAHGKLEKSQHPELHPSTTGPTPRPRRRMTVLAITRSASLASHCQQRRRTSHLEELTISIAMDKTELFITNMYISQASSCNGCHSPPHHMLTGTDSLVLGYFNASYLLWHSGRTTTRGNQLADSVSISSFVVLNTDSPTRFPGNAAPVLQMFHLHQPLSSPRPHGKHTRP